MQSSQENEAAQDPSKSAEEQVPETIGTGPEEQTAADSESQAETQEPADPFEGVPEVLKAALERKGFQSLTPVQSGALAAQREGRDLRLSSQTGSGKTVALGLVMAPALMDTVARHRVGPRALVIAPTRELAAQVRQELHWLYAGVDGLEVDCVMGGTIVGEERRRLRARPNVLVGTPGRLLDHVRSGALDLSDVAEVVLDEGDQMLDMGFRDELEAILDATPDGRQVHLVSATFSSDVLRLAERYQNNALAVEGTAPGAAHNDIDHVAHTVRPNTRYPALANVLSTAGAERCLVFVKTRAEAAQVAERLSGDGFSAGHLSGDLAQSQRQRTLAAFRRGRPSVLVATDVAARGLDIPEVALVVNYAMPFDMEAYTHRSGRTGRAGKQGVSVLLVPGSKERRVRRLMEGNGVELDFRPVPGAAEVGKALAEQARRKAEALLAENPEPAEEMLAAAKELVGDRDPLQVLAVLLGGDRSAVLRGVRSLDEVPAKPNRREREQDGGGRPGRGDFADGPQRATGPEPAYRAQPEDYVTFVINWGFRAGANPSRILATACRRGGVDRTAMGAIRMDAFDTYFEVSRDAAEAFEAAATAPDERDPDVIIRRAGPGETGPPPREFGGGARRRGGFGGGRGGPRRGGPRRGASSWGRGGPSRGGYGHGGSRRGGPARRGGQRGGYRGGYQSGGQGGYQGGGQGGYQGGYQGGGQGGYQGGGQRSYEGGYQDRGQGGGDGWRDTGFHGTDYRGSSTGGPRRGGYRRRGPRRGRGGYRPRQ